MSERDGSLVRGIGLLQATAANMLNMIGVGPFLTIPLTIAAMGGPQAMLGWMVGAGVAVCDGLVWAELGAAMPGAGGPYIYLEQAFGPKSLGRLMSFLFLWETVFVAPLSTASGAVGFAQYTKFLVPSLGPWQMKLLAAGSCLLMTILLYRDIHSIGRLSIAMWAVVMGTAAWILFGGLTNFQVSRVADFPPGAFHLSSSFFAGLGGATLIAMYDYGGYYNVCLFGGEVKNPGKTIPRSILISIGVVAVLYLSMNVSIINVIPWRDAMKSTAIVSDFMDRLYGRGAANLVTVLILWTAMASVFAILLGFSRVPYAAAAEGRFFSVFARLHPKGKFPSFSLVSLGIASAAACALSLEELIKALTVIQILVQFMAQCVAVVLIRRNRPDIARPFSMWLYPIPAVVALAGWLFILVASGLLYILAGLLLMAAGILAYLWRARRRGEWPFVTA
ncbi:MAG TPA: amino acid permease [Bryobacteraceae bacterium]|nr:amino acid permease [Bryobacteraceae bacterium]